MIIIQPSWILMQHFFSKDTLNTYSQSFEKNNMFGYVGMVQVYIKDVYIII